MTTDLPELDLRPLPAPLPMRHALVDHAGWSDVAQAVAERGGRLVALWGTLGEGAAGDQGASVSAALAAYEGLMWLELPLDAARHYPDLTPIFACATRMQRAAKDLSGVVAATGTEDDIDARPWLDHGLWPLDAPPLQPGARPLPGAAPDRDARATLPADYRFVRVEGEGVHEIAVGPVHAGIIEPGHFRFSVVGEKVLRLEQYLGYVHKGVEQRFTQLAPLDAHRLAGRISGDSTVAYAWAYCMALESAWQCRVPERAAWLRALLLERERVANHLGDLGALGNDAALAVGLAQFSRLREDWQRLSQQVFGHRLLMDAVLPGGVAVDPAPAALAQMRQQCDRIEREVDALRTLYDEHAGLQDRFMTTGVVAPALAAQLGLAGMAGRASGQAFDLRSDHDWAPYRGLNFAMATHREGDVAARVLVRFEELAESLRLIRALSAALPGGAVCSPPQPPGVAARGAGWVEGWRGEVLVALNTGADGRILRCHAHDPSWQNWPLLEHAVIGNIVADFPLINKSFNLSYSGHDL